MSDNIKKKLQSDSDIKKFLSNFYYEFKKAIQQTTDDYFGSEHGVSFHEEIIVVHTKVMNKASHDCVKRASDLLGTQYGNEKEVSDIIRNQAFDSISKAKSSVEFTKNVIDEIIEILEKDYEIFLPNSIVNLMDGVDAVEIGSVRILTLSQLEQELNPIIGKHEGNLKLNFLNGEGKMNLDAKGHQFSLPSSHVMWAVKTHSSKTNMLEEAMWRIGVALSLLRLSSRKWRSHFPQLGETEISPISQYREVLKNPLSREGDNFFTGGGSVPYFYDVSKGIASDIKRKKNQTLFESIYQFKPKKLSEQVFNALGWLSKARQENDRAAKLLYFFTAIETLLTRQDKNAPVSDTISRHASIILSRTIKGREGIAKDFKKLYGNRSQTVHTGKRSSSKSDVKKVQFFAESLLLVVMKKCNLKSSHEDFCSKLAKASYGSIWQS